MTRFWVWLETRGRARGDAMCGFRLYPLARTVALLDRVKIATGMSFDIDILVRLTWEGLPVESVETRVVYPPGGQSHFRLVRDNLRISATHARLFFSSFRRPAAAAHWSRVRERGALWGLRILVVAYRRGGRPLLHVLLYPVILYFFAFGAAARRASHNFLLRAHRAGSPGLPSPPTWRDSFRHFLSFAETTLDKIGAWLDKVPRQELELADEATWARLRANNRGCLLIGSHLGNLEVPRALARGRRAGTAVTALVFTQHAQKFNTLLHEVQPQAAFNLVEVGSIGPDTAIELRAVIDRGDLVVIVGDRTPVHSVGRTARVPFLGADADFSLGPYILGYLLECPVHLLFCVRDRERYREYLEPFAERISWTRATRDAALREYARRYAERLQHYALQTPFQWFNFYDFWREPISRS